MAGKKSGSDNPWAEMSRLNLNDKEAKAPAPDSPRAATIKSEGTKADATPAFSPEEVVEKSAAATGAVATKIEDADLKTNEEGEEVAENEEVVEYSAEDLQEMSLKELQALAKESGIDFKGLSKEELIDAIIEETGSEVEEEILLEEESDEEELEDEEIDGEMSLEEAMALLGEDSETEEDFSDVEFEEVEEVVQEGDVNFESDGNN